MCVTNVNDSTPLNDIHIDKISKTTPQAITILKEKLIYPTSNEKILTQMHCSPNAY